MARSSTGVGGSQRSVFSSLLAPVVFVAVAGIIGWLLLITVKWMVVTVMVALGIALILVPFLAGRKIVGPATGSNRTHRFVQLGTAVLLGIALIVLAVVVSRHGWLLIVVPAAVVLVGRIVGRISTARAARRERAYS
jgi:hypothetical protein